MFKNYLLLMKPGIIFGNLLTATAAFFLAARGSIDFFSLFSTIIGLACIIGSACICNNVIDQDTDRKMERTKKRPLVTGVITSKKALGFAFFLLITGSLLLIQQNWISLIAALFGFLFYVFAYSLSKYHTYHATLIGSIAGATPPVVGYLAASGRWDLTATLLFLLLVCWQMPHFFAIALYRYKDYLKASIPTLPYEKGILRTKKEMLFYTLAFSLVLFALPQTGLTGFFYFTSACLGAVGWTLLSIKGFVAKDEIQWAKKMFAVSLLIILALTVSIVIDSIQK